MARRPADMAHGGGARAGGSCAGPRRGFTLIETSLAVVIIGVGVIAMVDAQRAFMQSNGWSNHAATATLLANEIRELTRHMSRHDPVTGLELDGETLWGWGAEQGEITVQDFDDLDDFDGALFGAGGSEGPINAVGDIIYETDADGNVKYDETGAPIPLQGWSQAVFVEKLDPFNLATVVADEYFDPPSGNFDGREVDEFPLRVTVVVSAENPSTGEMEEVTRVTWVVP